MSAVVVIQDAKPVHYYRQESTDSGWENPFRPGGDLSREADQIVELIKEGKAITPTLTNPPSPLPQNGIANETQQTASTVDSLDASPPKKEVNYASPKAANGKSEKGKGVTAVPASPGSVEVQRETVGPADATQVEHVVIKKKPKCDCCVIQ